MNSNVRKLQIVKLKFNIPIPQYLHNNMQEVARLFLVILMSCW